MSERPLLQVDGITISHQRDGVPVRVVDDVSFAIRRGTTFGLIGESGSGKSTLARAIARLKAIDAGRIVLDGVAAGAGARTGPRERPLSGRVQMVFQDSGSSLNPRHTVAQIVAEPLVVHRVGDRAERARRVCDLLDSVGLPAAIGHSRPHELSGGQRQRVGIARALALNPNLVLLDEAVSALDLSVQAQILNLLIDLQAQRGIAYLFISHDLSVIRHMADDIAVLRKGVIVEQGSVDLLWGDARHPYTQGMIAAMPPSLPTLSPLILQD